MKEMHFIHMFRVYSTVVYRLVATVPRLDVTPLYHTITVMMGKTVILSKRSYDIM